MKTLDEFLLELEGGKSYIVFSFPIDNPDGTRTIKQEKLGDKQALKAAKVIRELMDALAGYQHEDHYIGENAWIVEDNGDTARQAFQNIHKLLNEPEDENSKI